MIYFIAKVTGKYDRVVMHDASIKGMEWNAWLTHNSDLNFVGASYPVVNEYFETLEEAQIAFLYFSDFEGLNNGEWEILAIEGWTPKKGESDFDELGEDNALRITKALKASSGETVYVDLTEPETETEGYKMLVKFDKDGALKAVRKDGISLWVIFHDYTPFTSANGLISDYAFTSAEADGLADEDGFILIDAPTNLENWDDEFGYLSEEDAQWLYEDILEKTQHFQLENDETEPDDFDATKGVLGIKAEITLEPSEELEELAEHLRKVLNSDDEDVVGNPSHYQLEDGTEVLDHIFAVLGKERFEGYALGNAIKYIGRAGKKDTKVQDLRKAQEYLGYQISVEETGLPKHQ